MSAEQMMGARALAPVRPVASYGKRVGGFLIDGLLAGLVTGAGYAAIIPTLLDGELGQAQLSGGALVAVMVSGALSLVLAIVQWWLQGTRGYTIGKKLVGTRTVDEVSGRPVGMGRILVRQLIFGVSAIVPAIGPILMWLSPLFDGEKRMRGWHDKVAGTVVIDAKRADRQAAPRPRSAGAPAGSYGAQSSSSFAPPTPRTPNTSGPQSSPWSPSAAAASAPSPYGAAPAPAAPAAVAPSAPAAAAYPAPPAAGYPPAPAAAPAAAYPAPPTVGYPAPPAAGPPAPAAPAPGYPPAAASAPAPAPSAPSAPSAPVGYPPAPSPVMTPPPAPVAPAASVAPVAAPSPVAPVTPPVAVHRADELDDDLEQTRLSISGLRAQSGTPGVIPPSATLRLSDGKEVTITGTVLLGRNPAPGADEKVDELIRVNDPGRSVSKTHLLVGVDDEGVWVVDRASTNGTIVTLADGQQIICAEHQVVRLPEGAVVAFGDYSASFEYANG
ncbi:MAG: RDD family protein [Cellulomonadaceae bacterium]